MRVVDGVHLPAGDRHTALARLGAVLEPALYVYRTMDLAVVSAFSRLGAGSFATVFVNECRGGAVVKQVKDPADGDLLDKEHGDLQRLHRDCTDCTDAFFDLPRPFGFYSDYWTFARQAGIPRTVDLGLPPHAMYVMQRVWPVSTSLTERIRALFFPPDVRDLPVAPFLARLYLGRATSRATSRFFCAENFALDAERVEQLGLPSDRIAAGMGQMLARINFRAGRDGRDIEFVLCGDPHNPLSGQPAYCCIDFNQMRPHGGDAAAIVDSIASNDPYVPRPPSPYWAHFAAAYATEAAAASAAASELARAVLSRLEERWRGCEP